MATDEQLPEKPPSAPKPKPKSEIQPPVPTSADLTAALTSLFSRLGISPDEPTARVILRSSTRLTQYRGPLPPPEMLAEYDKHIPGLAERIIGAWERQRGHREILERQSADRAETRMDKSQNNARTIAAVSIIGAVIVGIWGSWAAAAFIVIAGVGGPNAATVLARVWGSATPKEKPPRTESTNDKEKPAQS